MSHLPDRVQPRFVYNQAQITNRALLIDVRTRSEYESFHAKGAINIPLESLSYDKLNDRFPDFLPGAQPVFLLCQSGFRAEQAAQLLRREGLKNLAIVDGGTAAWRSEDLPTVHGKGMPSLERQVQIALGICLMLFLIKGTFLHPIFYMLIGVIASGLVYAGITAQCSLSSLLARMPWNRRASTLS